MHQPHPLAAVFVLGLVVCAYAHAPTQHADPHSSIKGAAVLADTGVTSSSDGASVAGVAPAASAVLASPADTQQSDAYRQANPFFEQCIERADRLQGQFGVAQHCGNVAQMTQCAPSCRRAFESYFRTLTTACWVEIIVGLDKLHPDVAQHWKFFGEQIDKLCYHPPPPPPVRHSHVDVPKPLPPADDTPKSFDADDGDAGDVVEETSPAGTAYQKDDFQFPQRFSEGMDTEFPDRIVPAPYVKPDLIADKLPWRRQHLQGRIGRGLDDETKANLEPDVNEEPNVKQQHIGPQDRIISFDSEREKGWLPGLDND